MFSSRNKKNNGYPCKPQFYFIKVGFNGGGEGGGGSKLYRYVFMMNRSNAAFLLLSFLFLFILFLFVYFSVMLFCIIQRALWGCFHIYMICLCYSCNPEQFLI